MSIATSSSSSERTPLLAKDPGLSLYSSSPSAFTDRLPQNDPATASIADTVTLRPADGGDSRIRIDADGHIRPTSASSAMGWSAHSLLADSRAGMTVALINVPLSISLALASGATPVAGIITAVWAGLVAAVTGGSQFNILGPTGALSGMLMEYSQRYGPSALPILCLTTAAVMLIVYALNWDKYLHLLSSSVFHGFTLGVALLIIGGQIAPIFSLAPQPHQQHANFFANLRAEIRAIPVHGSFASALLFAVSWLTLFSLVRWRSSVPWSVLIAATGIGVGWLSKHMLFFPLVTLGDKFSLEATLWRGPLDWRNEAIASDPRGVLTASLSLAFVAVLESLISGKIADAMASTHMDTRREVLGCALANFAAGLAGGLPATAALARTSLNVKSGAFSRMAAVLNAVLTGLIALLLLPLFNYLPLPVVGALLFQVAVGMVDSEPMRMMWRLDRPALLLTIVVALLCLWFDPTVGIVVGALIGLLYSAEQLAAGNAELILTNDFHMGKRLDLTEADLAEQVRRAWTRRGTLNASNLASTAVGSRRNSRTDFEVTNATDADNPSVIAADESLVDVGRHGIGHNNSCTNIVIYRIIGDLTYLSALSHSERIARLLRVSDVILSFRYCSFIDIDGFHSIEDACSQHQRQRDADTRRVFLCSINAALLPRFAVAEWFAQMQSVGRVFDSAEQAMQVLQRERESAHSAALTGEAHRRHHPAPTIIPATIPLHPPHSSDRPSGYHRLTLDGTISPTTTRTPPVD